MSILPRPLRTALGYLAFPARLLARADQRRYIGPWLASLAPGALGRGVPWLTFAAIEHLDGVALAGCSVFEWGSGGSTVYWLRRGAQVVSVEHDRAWYGRVRAALGVSARLDYRLVEPEPAPAEGYDPADPTAFRSAAIGCEGLSFRRYAEQITSFPAGHFDLVLVDGRARPACLALAATRVRLGGRLILDNSERLHYTAALGDRLRGFAALRLPGAVPYVPVISETTIYTRQA